MLKLHRGFWRPGGGGGVIREVLKPRRCCGDQRGRNKRLVLKLRNRCGDGEGGD